MSDMTGRVLELTEGNFAAETGGAVPILVDFWAEWCGPCRQIAPVVSALAASHAGRLRVGKLDVDAYPAVAARLGVQGIPTLMLFHRGRQVTRWVGSRPGPVLTGEVDEALDELRVAEVAFR